MLPVIVCHLLMCSCYRNTPRRSQTTKIPQCQQMATCKMTSSWSCDVSNLSQCLLRNRMTTAHQTQMILFSSKKYRLATTKCLVSLASRRRHNAHRMPLSDAYAQIACSTHYQLASMACERQAHISSTSTRNPAHGRLSQDRLTLA